MGEKNKKLIEYSLDGFEEEIINYVPEILKSTSNSESLEKGSEELREVIKEYASDYNRLGFQKLIYYIDLSKELLKFLEHKKRLEQSGKNLLKILNEKHK